MPGVSLLRQEPLARAYAACETLARSHYENFPVLAPSAGIDAAACGGGLRVCARRRRHRRRRDGAARSAAIAARAWQSRLHEAVATGRDARPPETRDDLIVVALGHSIRSLDLPVALFDDLLSAFGHFDATQRATVWLQGRIGELRDRSQEAALEVETFRAENGLTAARGELMSEQQLSDLNSQLVVAQADTANALARYTQYKSIIDSGPENAVKNATIPTGQGQQLRPQRAEDPLPQYHQARTGRYRRALEETIRRRWRCAANRLM